MDWMRVVRKYGVDSSGLDLPESTPVTNALALVAVGAGSAIVTSLVMNRRHAREVSVRTQRAYEEGRVLGRVEGARLNADERALLIGVADERAKILTELGEEPGEWQRRRRG